MLDCDCDCIMVLLKIKKKKIIIIQFKFIKCPHNDDSSLSNETLRNQKIRGKHLHITKFTCKGNISILVEDTPLWKHV